nr:cytochrome b6-f complex subunit PetL [Leptolyngbya sp. FACHB-16]
MDGVNVMGGAIAYIVMLGGAAGTAIGLYYGLRLVKLI